MNMQQIGWVLLGLLSALGLGFLLGLARPHPPGDYATPAADSPAPNFATSPAESTPDEV